MQKLFLFFFILSCFSCRKGCQDIDNNKQFNETYWNLYYKINSTFSFYAQSELYFKEDKTIDNYRNFDTITGSWSASSNTVVISFNNGDKYNGTIITNDSISGTLTASGNSGIWYATRR